MESITIDLVLCKIVAALESENSLLAGVSNELECIKQELDCMKSFLKEASRLEGQQTEQEKTWVAQVRDKSAQIEDVLDEFIYQKYKQRWQSGRFPRLIRKTVYFPKSIWMRHQVATKLQKIKKDVVNIREQNKRYGVNRLEGSGSRRGRGSSSGSGCREDYKGVDECRVLARFTGQRDVVGMQDQVRELSEWVTSKEPELTVVAIVGMGGSGKTTLTGQLYNDDNIRGKFQCCAWVTVSKIYETEDLLRKVIIESYDSCHEKLPCNLNDKSLTQLVNMLLNYLKPRKFLIVLDDVWDVELWQKVKVSLQNSVTGSRVMLTTRDQAFANLNYGVKKMVHHIRQLASGEAWKLFCQNAFSPDTEKCPEEFENLTSKLLKKCIGLPLAIKALGGLFHSKNSLLEWNNIYNSLNQKMNRELTFVKIILSLSFDDLPFKLKNCFLYCSLFPEDYVIEVGKLVKMWIAEGFIEQIEKIAIEIEAENYVKRLVARNMLEVVYKTPSGRLKMCKMHDMMRDLALSKAEEERFCTVCDGSETEKVSKACRLSITAKGELNACSRMKYLRTFHVFIPHISKLPSSNTIPSGFKLLRVLNLERFPIDKVPEEIGNLFNLRYLNLSWTRIKEIPEFIGSLRNLQTIGIAETNVCTLPKGIAKLEHLRHLVGFSRYGFHSGFKRFKGMRAQSHTFRKLMNLQVLLFIEVRGNMVRELSKMKQLTELGITDFRAADQEDLCYSIEQMNHLQRLSVCTVDEDELLKIDKILKPPCFLESIYLCGKLAHVPSWLLQLCNLTYLVLRWSRLEEDPLPYIQELPNLGELWLVNAYSGSSLHFQSGFPKLDRIKLIDFPQLSNIIIDNGAMPKLVNLEVTDCMNLKHLPHGMEHLGGLKFLKLEKIPEELVESIRGEWFPKLQHICKIHYWYTTSCGKSIRENLSSSHLRRQSLVIYN